MLLRTLPSSLQLPFRASFPLFPLPLLQPPIDLNPCNIFGNFPGNFKEAIALCLKCGNLIDKYQEFECLKGMKAIFTKHYAEVSPTKQQVARKTEMRRRVKVPLRFFSAQLEGLATHTTNKSTSRQANKPTSRQADKQTSRTEMRRRVEVFFRFFCEILRISHTYKPTSRQANKPNK